LARTHLTQAERSERTRGQLFDATIECLIDLGYAGTSMNEICKRAGLSRGAQQHHFATKAELMAQAMAHLVTKLRDQVLESVGSLDDNDRIATGIQMLSQAFSGTLATAALELWVAARTDQELRAVLLPVGRALGRSTFQLYRKVAWHDVPEDQAETLYWLTLNLTRGLALDAMLGGDPLRRKHLLAEWQRIATTTLRS
jgi:AcrR family transcriptional regulator